VQRAARTLTSEGSTADDAGPKDHAGFLEIFVVTGTDLDPLPVGGGILGMLPSFR
jgi:hypothetical protein